MQIRPVILVLFVILLSEKNRIMRNLCTSMYNFIMFVYLFVFLDMRLILITHTGNFDNILIIELYAIKFWVVGYWNMVVWIMVCSCEKWTFCCITNEKALKPCFLIRFLLSTLFNFSHFSITLIEYFICNIGITIQILLYKGAIHCSVQIPLIVFVDMSQIVQFIFVFCIIIYYISVVWTQICCLL